MYRLGNLKCFRNLFQEQDWLLRINVSTLIFKHSCVGCVGQFKQRVDMAMDTN